MKSRYFKCRSEERKIKKKNKEPKKDVLVQNNTNKNRRIAIKRFHSDVLYRRKRTTCMQHVAEVFNNQYRLVELRESRGSSVSRT